MSLWLMIWLKIAAYVEYVMVFLYADDTKLYGNDNLELQYCLNNVEAFTSSRQLSLARANANTLPSTISIVATMNILLSANAIPSTRTVKDLGIFVSQVI